jgi:TolA-binding protein
MYPGGVYSERVQELVVLAENQSPFPISLPTLEYKPEARGSGPSFGGGGGGGAAAKPTASLDHLFEKGKELFDNGSMSEALAIFKNLSQNYTANSDDDEQIIANASFFAGKCFYKSGASDPASKSLMKYVESQPQGQYAKEAYLILGNLARDAGDTERAGSLYYQVIEMGGDDEFVQEATSQKGSLE